MAEFILTWNPTKWVMEQAEYDELVTATSEGREVPGNWSVGVRTGGIGLGDHAYLLRQHSERGIIAAGYFTSEVYQDVHWDGSEREANYANVAWTTWLDLDDRLTTEVLKARVPGVAWDLIQGSGVKVPATAAVALDELWTDHLDQVGRQVVRSSEEVLPSATYREGAVTRIEVNRYERDPKARAQAIAHHGLDCVVCGFNFEVAYGPELGREFIHVHHLRELASLPDGYEVDPVADLVPVCANCHSMLHRKRPALTPAQLRRRLRSVSS
jgi:5-methylcytosine-specific restriction protein A